MDTFFVVLFPSIIQPRNSEARSGPISFVPLSDRNFTFNFVEVLTWIFKSRPIESSAYFLVFCTRACRDFKNLPNTGCGKPTNSLLSSNPSVLSRGDRFRQFRDCCRLHPSEANVV